MVERDLVNKYGSHAGRGVERQGVCGSVKFRTAIAHPSRNVRQSFGDVRMDGRAEFWNEKVELVSLG